MASTRKCPVARAAVLALLLAGPVPPAWAGECTAPRSVAEILALVAEAPASRALRESGAAAEGLAEQAGARINPEVSVNLEDFTGSGDYSRFGLAQSTVALWQRVELGTRRTSRSEAARRRSDAARARGAGEAVTLAAVAKQRFVLAVAAREDAHLTADAAGLAESLVAAARALEQSGAGRAAEVDLARVDAEAARLEAAAAARASAVAARRLGAMWGAAAPTLPCLEEALPARLPPPASAPVPASDEESPALKVAAAEAAARRAEVDAARAAANPDLEVGAGLRHLAGPDQVSVVAGLRIEVPIFDRNQGAVTAAEREMIAAGERLLGTAAEVAAERARLEAEFESAVDAAQSHHRDILPPARRAADELARAWEAGSASLAEVLAARRRVVELERGGVAARRDAHLAAVALEALGGRIGNELAASTEH